MLLVTLNFQLFFDNCKTYPFHVNGNDSSTIAIHREYLSDYLNILVRLKEAAKTDSATINNIRVNAETLISLINKEYN